MPGQLFLLRYCDFSRSSLSGLKTVVLEVQEAWRGVGVLQSLYNGFDIK